MAPTPVVRRIKMAKLTKEELEELQNPETWEDIDETVQPTTKPARAVVSVAFARDDFETVVEAAKQRGMKTSEFIRQAALEKTSSHPQRAKILVVSGSVQTGYAAVSGPRVKTTVTTYPESGIYATT
jgi:hypothetical protein